MPDIIGAEVCKGLLYDFLGCSGRSGALHQDIDAVANRFPDLLYRMRRKAKVLHCDVHGVRQIL